MGVFLSPENVCACESYARCTYIRKEDNALGSRSDSAMRHRTRSERLSTAGSLFPP